MIRILRTSTLIVATIFALVVFPLALVWTASPALAQDTEAGEGEAEEDEEPIAFFGSTNVTATGSEAATFDTPAPVVVLEADRLEELVPDNAADALRDAPGVDVNGIGPNQMRPIIRGQRGHRVLFLQDGLRMNNARRQTDFGEITGLVDMSNVQSLELVRGAGSVLYGSDAIGGVLNLITKVPAGTGIKGSVGLRYSDADEQSKVDASASGRFDDFSFTVGVSARDADNYEAPSGSFGNIRLDNDIVVNDTGVEDQSFNLYFSHNPSDNSEVFLRAGVYSADDFGFGFIDPAVFNETTLNRITYPFQDYERFTFGYSGAGLDSGWADTVDVRGYLQNNERDNGFFIDINIGPIFGPGPSSNIIIDSLVFSDIETHGVRFEATKAISEKNLLTYGLEFFEDDVGNARNSTTAQTFRAVFPLTFIPPCFFTGQGGTPIPPTFHFECTLATTDTRPSSPNATNSGQGLFIQDTIYANRLTATIGARFARSETRAKETLGWDTTGLDFDDDNIVGALGLVYGVSDKLNLVATYATAFRAPNIIERLFNGITPEGFGFQILNTDLESEDSVTIDVGFKYQSRRAFFEAIYFDNEIDNAIIQYTFSPAEIAALPQDVQDEVAQAGVSFVVQQRNAEVLTIDGVELSAGYRFDGGFSLGGTFTSLDGEAEVGGPAADPTGSTFSEKITAFARYDSRSGRFWGEYRVRQNGEEDQQLDPGAPIPPVGRVLPDFTIHNLAFGLSFGGDGRFSHNVGLSVTNATDELYAEFSNASFFRPQPGQNVILTYRLRKD